jgi:hypothetical protein
MSMMHVAATHWPAGGSFPPASNEPKICFRGATTGAYSRLRFD